jgi:hypothetical protein
MDEELEILDRKEADGFNRSWGTLCGIPGIAIIVALVGATLYLAYA